EWAMAPLLRIYVHILGNAKFRCTFSFHHAILDGWSLAGLTTELAQRYDALLSGSILPDNPPLASFRDFIALEQRAVEQEENWAFWAQTLTNAAIAGVPRLDGVSEVPEIERLPIEISDQTAKRLRDLSIEQAVSIKTLMAAAYIKTLSIITGETDVV